MDSVEKIDRYLSNELTEEELVAFENRLQTDDAFAEEVKGFKDLIQSLEALGFDDFTAQLNTWEQKHQTVSNIRPLHSRQKVDGDRFKLLKIAAGIVIIFIPMALGLNYFVSPSEASLVLSEDALFEAEFVPADNIHRLRNSIQPLELSQLGEEPTEAQLKNIYQLGMVYYDQKDFGKAIQYLSAYMKYVPENLLISLYLGISYLGNENTEAAKSIFEHILTKPESMQFQEAEWYLALTFLRQKNIEAYKKQLNKIATNEFHMYQAKAIELLTKSSSF